jgi:hypothetical protein
LQVFQNDCNHVNEWMKKLFKKSITDFIYLHKSLNPLQNSSGAAPLQNSRWCWLQLELELRK